MKNPLVAAVVLGLASTSDAALISRLGGQAVYDTELDITWLSNANLAATQTFGVAGVNADGTMSWITAHYDWLPAMNALGGSGYLGYSDWRLPRTLIPDPDCSNGANITPPYSGRNCRSEMGHLFYDELGGTVGDSILDSGDPDVALFSNLAGGPAGGFWSDTRQDSNINFAYYFSFVTGTEIGSGVQLTGPIFNDDQWAPWGVRDGDVADVPEPSGLYLLGAGLSILWRTRSGRSSC